MRILIYGDSNTYGTAPMPRLGADGVVDRRWGDVVAAELPDHEIVIEGLPGRTTVHDDPIEGAYRNGLTVLPAILHSHAPVDLLVICLGTNDHKARFSLTGIDIALGLGRLVREAKASGVVRQILLVAPPPAKERGDFAEMFAGAEARSIGLADKIARVARTEEAGFFDAGQVIASDDLDGIHWSADSHVTLGAALAHELRVLLG